MPLRLCAFRTRLWTTILLVFSLAATGCLRRPTSNPNVIVVSLSTGPNNLDPRMGTDDTSQRIHELMFDALVDLNDHLRVVPRLAERFDHPDPLTYVATLRRGVRFHDGHELTAADVVHTFKTVMDPRTLSPKRGAFSDIAALEAPDPYTVIFKLTKPFESFPVNVVNLPIVPATADALLRTRPIGTGPYRFTRYLVDDRVELTASDNYFGGRAQNDGLLLKIVPDDVMRGLELRKGTMDVVVNDLAPDIVYQLKEEKHLQTVDGPGLDYQYIGVNLRDPALQDVRVRQALAYAIDKQAIVEHLRRGLAVPADGILPKLSWASAPDLMTYPRNIVRAKTLLDEAGYVDPDGSGPAPRLRLTLKVSNVEFNRLQSAVIQQDLEEIGVALDVRTYEFATLYADVLSGNFQLYTLQWAAGALADPDILRRVFHSSQVPPAGFNRGHFNNPQVDALLDKASSTLDETQRLALYNEVQQIVSRELPYLSLWHKRNVAVAQRTLTGIQLSPLGNLVFLKDVARTGS